MILSPKRYALSFCALFSLGFLFTHAGCGSSRQATSSDGLPRGDAEVPERIALQLRTCAAKSLDHLHPPDRSISFDVKLTNDGAVDSVALRDSTLDDDILETCMAQAIRALQLDDLSMRRSERDSPQSLPLESRAVMGQAEEVAAGCLASPPCLLTVGFLILTTYIAVQIFVHAAPPSGISKQKCIDMYVNCTNKTPDAPCGDCLHYCRAQREWPEWRCPQ